ncbi:MAG: pilus assembly PilX family protein [Rhodanobacteraceae bacterium]
MVARRPQPSFPRRARERGVVLLLALIFLVLLTLLAIGASSGSLLQQRMVSATRSAQLATMSADTALRGAEWQLWSYPQVTGAAFDCAVGAIDATTGCVVYDPESPLYAANGAVTLFRTGDNAWLTTGIAYSGPPGHAGYTAAAVSPDTGSPNVADNPRYIIEKMGRVQPGGPQHEAGDTGPNNGGPGQPVLYTYRITARATGGSQNTVRVVQSTFDAQGN